MIIHNNYTIKLLIIFFTMILTSCSYFKKDETNVEQNKVERKKKVKSANIDQKVASSEGTIFGELGGKQNTFQFSTSNVLWRASLSTLEDIPLLVVDYSGGMIITDWYSPKLSNESIKIVVNFVDNEVRATSINLKAFKKKCTDFNKCETKKLSQEFNQKIKANILSKARELKIMDNNKK